MNIYILYGIVFLILIALELVYFKIADKFNIIDKPNERSSHSTIVLRGGGIIFLLGAWVWAIAFGFQYPWFLAAVTLAAGISFVDDIKSLPDAARLVVQFLAMALIYVQVYLSSCGTGFFTDSNLLVTAVMFVVAMIVFVGATNIYNFMDGINGITAGYSLSILVPLVLLDTKVPFMDNSFLIVIILSVLVFSFFNFRPKGKAKCFAGDVGSVGMAFILLFAIGLLIVATEDITWLIFLLVYGVDGCLTIIHRFMLHEHLGEAHRKHAYQIMANELKMSHPVVALIYTGIQLIISLGFIYLIPNTVTSHWIYLLGALLMLSLIYVIFMKKYYHLHEEYLESLKK